MNWNDVMAHPIWAITTWSKQPHYKDPDDKLSAAYIQSISLIIIVSAILVGIVYAIEGQAFYVSMSLLEVLVYSIVIVLVRFYKLRIASNLFLVSALLLLSFGIFSSGGIHSSSSILYPVILVFASLLLDRRSYSIYGLLSLISIGFIIYAENQGLTPVAYVPDPPRFPLFVTYAMVIVAVGGIIRSITESLQTSSRKARQFAQEIYTQKVMLDRVGQAVVGCGIDNKVIYWNKAATDLYGWTEDRALGQVYYDLIPTMLTHEMEDEIGIVLRNGETWSGELVIQDKDGNELHVLVTVAPLQDENGEITGWIGIGADLTERKHTEEALRLSEEKFSKAFHTTPILMTIEDENHFFIDVNKAFLSGFGFNREEVIGHSATELRMFSSPDDAFLLRNTLQNNNGVLKDFELQINRKSGEIGFVSLSSERIYVDKAEYILTSGLDITERKFAELQIQKQAARAEVLASLSQLLTKVSQDQRLVFDNVVRRCAELIGDGASIFLYSPQNEFLELVAVYNPDPQAMDVFWDEISKRPIRWNEGVYAKAIGDVEPVLIPYINVNELIKRATPERRDYYRKLPFHSMMIAPLHIQGNVMGVIGMARHSPGRNYTPEDLTFLQDIADRSSLALLNAQYYKELEQELAERKIAEKKYRSIFDNSIDGIFQSTDDGHFINVNPAMANIYGYESPEEMLNCVTDISSQLYASADQREDVRQRLNSGERLVGYESLDYRKDGSTFWASMSAQAIRDENGKALYYEGTIEDITPRKKAEAERESLIQELANKNAELEQFTYTVSHDLKSPLVTINGFVGYLEQDAASGNMERLKNDTTRIQEAVNKMQKLLNELLELSRVGRLMNASEKVPVETLVREALDNVHGQLEERGVDIQIQPDLPSVYGDNQRLVEVFQNLLDNAIKYMGNQTNPEITIGQNGEEDDKPIFFVKDNGMGIDFEHHERIFGLFNKLDAKSEGTGVGLALVKRIVEVHGGRIWIRSDAGKGSTFYFTLPTPPSI